MFRSLARFSASPASRQKLLILYGSQTGTAEGYAKMLGTFAASNGLTPVVHDMNSAVSTYAQEAADAKAVAFVCSTYGTGEAPANSEEFFNFLKKGGAKDAKTRFSVLGLGNSKNDHFNAAGKELAALLESNGSSTVVPSRFSCELAAGGHDAMFRQWKRDLFAALTTSSDSASAGLKPVYQISECMATVAEKHLERLRTFHATVHGNHHLTPAGYEPRSNMLSLRVPTSVQKEYLGREAGPSDNIEVIAENSDASVARVIKRLGLSATQLVEITPLAGAPKSFFDNHKMSVHSLLKEVVDINAIPTRSLLEIFASRATNAAEKARLQDLADNLTEGSEYDKLTRGVFAVVDCLEMFPSVNVTLADLVSFVPHLATRTYSIANDHADGRHEDFELVYTVPSRHADGRHHEGVASSYLERLTSGKEVRCRFVPSTFKTPSFSEPLVIVALGSGIGVARAQLQARASAKAAGKQVAPALLYYGFRHTHKDDLFTKDLKALEAAGIVKIVGVASHDTATFATPMQKFDDATRDFIGDNGNVLYCGLGGSVPGVVEGAFVRVGVNVSALRKAGRYHEEYFTVDVDSENAFKHHSADAGGKTLAAKMGDCDMFCMQCEQTFKGTGCFKTGVCGKTPRVAALQDLSVHAAKILGSYLHELRLLGAAENHAANRLSLYALFTTLTNVNFDEKRFVTLIGDLKTQIDISKALYAKQSGGKTLSLRTVELPEKLPDANGLIALGRSVGVLSRFVDPSTQNQAAVTEMLMYGLKGIAAYTDHSLMNGKESAEVYEFLHRALHFLLSPDASDLGKGLGFCLEAGKVNVTSMGMLYDSNKTLGVPTPATVPVTPRPGKCILISGHDLIILKGLLDVCEPLGINVYTHGEMLPAHSYPTLKKYKCLAGNYGGAWMRQSVEFPHFPGPVLMTTNCLTEPHKSYADRLFTAGAVGWANIPHIGNTMQDINFEAVVKAAQAAPGFTAKDTAFAYADPVGQKRPQSLTVGFGHETILSVAPTIIEQIQKGNITRFFVVGGCDGFEGQRSYYTDLVANLPKTAVILTVGCGKFRINHLNLGTIGDTGIPRILDMGQCNDSFSAVQVALALAGVLKCNVSDLPLSIVLSWFEQKAVAVLLSCLHLGLKPIYIGPSLPAFVTPDVLNVLVKDFGVRPTGDPIADGKAMVACKGMME